MQTGLEHLIDEQRHLVHGRRVGLLCHAASVDRRLRHAADLLAAAGADLRLLFGPEHGVRGEAQDMVAVDSQHDPRLGLPVVSLYGTSEATLAPPPGALEGLDLVLVDLQDVGSRYYTYVWTAVLLAERCAEAGVAVALLDRPNPLGGEAVEGPSIQPGYTSFVGLHPVPVRHGLTLGELVPLALAERGVELELSVVPCRGWQRGLRFDATGLPWVLPSPNMPTLDTALVYPGGCLLEGTALSEGRGTTRPFEICGAPWIDGFRLAEALAGEGIPGVAFRPLAFSPTFQKHAGRSCGGLQLHVSDPERLPPLRLGVAILQQARSLWPESFAWRAEAYEFVQQIPAIDLLAGGPWLREGVERGASLAELCEGWAEAEAQFRQRRAPFLLYP